MTVLPDVVVLDYGAGNITSLLNALTHLHVTYKITESPDDILTASKLIFPGVGSFKTAINALHTRGYTAALKEYLRSDRPFLGICVGMQVLFEGSAESDGVTGLSHFKGRAERFCGDDKAVPHIGWSETSSFPNSPFYFVHSYAVMHRENDSHWENDVELMLSKYGSETFVAGLRQGKVYATQFHPEKSSNAGLDLINSFINDSLSFKQNYPLTRCLLSKPHPRIIACMDVCEDESGELVVTKGESYNIIDKDERIRNHGDPAVFAKVYYEQGADEIVFLNITGYKKTLLQDAPMLKLLKETSKNVFIPFTVGGGIRSCGDYTALDIADAYFRAGADKVSIGSDAVSTAQEYLKKTLDLKECSIKQISDKYGRQAVVVSLDPRRVYVKTPSETLHSVIKTDSSGPNGEEYVWYQCMLKGGRLESEMDVIQVSTICEELGAGEILLNSIDRDGQGNGYDIELLKWVKSKCGIPVIASSGAGNSHHFIEAFANGADACLAAGIFHRGEVNIKEIKSQLYG